MNRRAAVGALAGTAGALLHGKATATAPQTRSRLKQSVSYWPYSKIPLPEFARQAKQIGLAAIDLLQPEEWPVVRDAGLLCSMGYPTKRRDFLTSGFNHPSKHDMIAA